ncbi:MAG: hypothetical protein O2987_04000, partial [Firmicutes bacterium]|nr:hypothetical protein [Bacillota bacterium]
MVTSKPKQKKSFDYPKLISYILVFLSIFLFIWFVATRRTSDFKLYLITDTYGPLIFEGFLNTIWISIVALLGSVVLGFIFYLFSITKDKYIGAYLRAFTNVFTEIIYGTPLLVMVVIAAFVIGPAFNIYSRNITGLI